MSSRLPTEIWNHIFGILTKDLKNGEPYPNVYHALVKGSLLCKDSSEPARRFLYESIQVQHPDAAVKLYDTLYHWTPRLGIHTVHLDYKLVFGKCDMGSLILERLCHHMPNLTEMVLTPHQCSIAARNVDLWARLRYLVIDYIFQYQEAEDFDEETNRGLTCDYSLRMVPSPPPNLEYLKLVNAIHLLCYTQWKNSDLSRLKRLVLEGTIWYPFEGLEGRHLPQMPELVYASIIEGKFSCTETASRFIHIIQHELHDTPLQSLSMDLNGQGLEVADLFGALRHFTRLQEVLYQGEPPSEPETALTHLIALPIQRLDLVLSCHLPFMSQRDSDFQFLTILLAALRDAGTLSVLKQCPRISFSMVDVNYGAVSKNTIIELERSARVSSERLSLRPGLDVTTDWVYKPGCREFPILPCPNESYLNIMKASPSKCSF